MVGMVLEIRMGDVVRLRKPHPCGGYEWQVVRLGADIGMVCSACGRRVLLPRREFEKRVKTFVRRGSPTADARAQSPNTPLEGSRQ
jgi:hypothetical protein